MELGMHTATNTGQEIRVVVVIRVVVEKPLDQIKAIICEYT
jgi:hypothetical protein